MFLHTALSNIFISILRHFVHPKKLQNREKSALTMPMEQCFELLRGVVPHVKRVMGYKCWLQWVTILKLWSDLRIDPIDIFLRNVCFGFHLKSIKRLSHNLWSHYDWSLQSRNRFDKSCKIYFVTMLQRRLRISIMQWPWHSWQSSCYRHQRTWVRIQYFRRAFYLLSKM